MTILLMILGVCGLLVADKAVELLAAISILVFAVWLDGGFDSVVGVC